MNVIGPDVPGSILFLSCDIVGSTKFKQDPKKDWQRTFASFYQEFPQQLATVSRSAHDKVDFSLWKGIGDELLFTCRVTSAPQVFSAVRAWIAAMDAYQASSLEAEGLGTKGGAFIATFPWPDGECVIPRDPGLRAASDLSPLVINAEALQECPREHNRYQYDYFGPSIDTGFRLFSGSSQRYFTLSVEVAWAMLYCNGEATHQPNAFGHCKDLDDLILLRPEAFKGVWSGRDYPVLALDRQFEDPVHVAYGALAEGSDGPRLDKLMALCKACSESPDWPSRLYLPDTTFEPFASVPQAPNSLTEDNEMEGVERIPAEAPESTGGLSGDVPTD